MTVTMGVRSAWPSLCARAGVLVLSLACLFTAAPAAAQPPGPPRLPTLPEVIDGAVPPPPGIGSDPEALRRAVLPADAGDSFFDHWPAGLAQLRNGHVITSRDVTGVAAPLMLVPVARVRQVKFRTTDAHNAPSFGTATLAVPAAPWPGPGPRPVVINNIATDGLGRACSAGYTMAHGLKLTSSPTDFIPPITQVALSRGFAVLMPDHEGPRMAYAEPNVAGRTVLDAVRAVRAALPQDVGGSRFAMFGYSGGAIATVAAAKLAGSYAPELATVIAGAAAAGVPADFEMLTRTMNGNLASSFFLAAVFGIAREHPQALLKMNNLARWITTSPLKDQCVSVIALPGILMLPIDIAANITNPLQSPVAREVLAATRMPGMRSAIPLAIINGEQEFWIPAAGARDLFRQQCELGATAQYIPIFGEHIIGMATSFEPALTWITDRLRGVPAPNGCRR